MADELSTGSEVVLQMRPDGKPAQTVANHVTVLVHDHRFAGKIRFDEFSAQIMLCGAVPWDENNVIRPWANRDDSSAFAILQSEFGLKSRQDFVDSISIVAHQNHFHPIRECLDVLPPWDGKDHAGDLPIRFLGASDTAYVRAIIKLWMTGAVSRIYQPGSKFDFTLILVGRQGIGKSSFVRRLSLSDSWFSDSLGDLDGDRAAQSLLGSWIIELGELKSIARTSGGIESVKRFLTATSDKIRLPYQRRTEIFLRQCVFVGTTNKGDFLTDETGNRRFLILPVGATEPKESVFDDLFLEEAKAAWSQIVHLWKNGEASLTLPQEFLEDAERLRINSKADTGTRGLIESYLEDKERVCVLEIWQEALMEYGRPTRAQASEIVDIILSSGEWKRMKSPARFGTYGMQRGFQRCNILSTNPPGDCLQDGDLITEEYEETPFDD